MPVTVTITGSSPVPWLPLDCGSSLKEVSSSLAEVSAVCEFSALVVMLVPSSGSEVFAFFLQADNANTLVISKTTKKTANSFLLIQFFSLNILNKIARLSLIILPDVFSLDVDGVAIGRDIFYSRFKFVQAFPFFCEHPIRNYITTNEATCQYLLKKFFYLPLYFIIFKI